MNYAVSFFPKQASKTRDEKSQLAAEREREKETSSWKAVLKYVYPWIPKSQQRTYGGEKREKERERERERERRGRMDPFLDR